jgi:hypothetical protein
MDIKRFAGHKNCLSISASFLISDSPGPTTKFQPPIFLDNLIIFIMADADEDVVHTPSATAVPPPEVDLSDETQDFRFLNHLNLYEHLLSDMTNSAFNGLGPLSKCRCLPLISL